MIKVAYYDSNNLGDRLSPELVHWLSGNETKCQPDFTADIFAVGSILNFYLNFHGLRNGIKAWLHREKIYLRRLFSKKTHVWGSGFIVYPNYGPSIFLKDVEWHALRGKVSLEILKGIPLKESLHFSKEFTLGDPGLLYKELFPGEKNIQYDLGIIPHMNDQKDVRHLLIFFQKLGLRVKMLDVLSSPNVFFNEIRSCEVILSSSLHGLIIADSLGIPNRHIVFSTLKLTEKDFSLKFDDYYSIFPQRDLCLPILPKDAETLGCRIIREIHDTYRISSRQIEECRLALLNAFPHEFRKRS